MGVVRFQFSDLGLLVFVTDPVSLRQLFQVVGFKLQVGTEGLT